MLWVYGRYWCYNSLCAGIVFRRQNLTSSDVRFSRLKTVPALKGLRAIRTCISPGAPSGRPAPSRYRNMMKEDPWVKYRSPCQYLDGMRCPKPSYYYADNDGKLGQEKMIKFIGAARYKWFVYHSLTDNLCLISKEKIFRNKIIISFVNNTL